MIPTAHGSSSARAVQNEKAPSTTLPSVTWRGKVTKIITDTTCFIVGAWAVQTIYVVSVFVYRIAEKAIATMRQAYLATDLPVASLSLPTVNPPQLLETRQLPQTPPATRVQTVLVPPAPRHEDMRVRSSNPVQPREQEVNGVRRTPAQQRERRGFFVNQGCWHMKVDRQKLKDSPEDILNNIVYPCYARLSSPRQIFVTFKGERGIDYGGPGREFLSLLFNGLCSKESDVLQFVEESGGFLPRIRNQTATSNEILQPATLDPKCEGILQTVGALLAFSERMGDYPIGHVFSPLLFDMLVEFTHQDARLPFSALCSDFLLGLFKVRQKENNAIQKMYQLCKTTVKKLKEDREWKVSLLYFVYPTWEFPDYFLTNDEPDLAKLESNFDLFQKSMKEQLYRQALADPVLACVHAIANGMSRSFGSQRLWLQMASKGSSALRNTIQGAISKEVVLKKIQCRNQIIDNYIRRWLSRATNVQLEKFVKASTGSTRLGVKQTLTIMATRDTKRHVAFHTCNGQIDVPLYTKYEVFKQKFDESITNALASGFTLA